jgi:hypothetical protein
VSRTWRIVLRVTSIVGVVAPIIHYGHAVVGFIVRLNGWTAMLILCSSALLVGGVFSGMDYLNRRFETTDQSLRETMAEESNTLGHRISQETARLDAALEREINNRAGGDQMDRARIGQLESRVAQLENERRRITQQPSSPRPVA